MLRKVLTLLVVAIWVTSVYAQDRKFSAELSYPIALGNNFFELNYSGIIDAGLDFYFAKAGIFDFGVGVNTGIFNTAGSPDELDLEVLAFDVKFAAFAEVYIPGADRLRPALGVGYNAIIFSFIGTNPVNTGADSELIGEETRGGFNAHIRLAYDFAARWFVQAQYDYTKLGSSDGVPNTSFNTNVSVLKTGLGFRF